MIERGRGGRALALTFRTCVSRALALEALFVTPLGPVHSESLRNGPSPPPHAFVGALLLT